MDQLLRELGAKHRFRDPIYGFIYITDAERKIIDTPLFQRLRRIHQLALTKYVYPTAEHSRFVHSLGVLHAATEMFSGVVSNRRTPTSTLFVPEMKVTYAKMLRFASLLHDIGHLSFSHAAESMWLDGLSHEDLSVHIIQNYPPIRDILEEEETKPANVAALLTDKYPARHRLLHEIISGHLDADRADYLLRDSYCCGVKYGEYDFYRYRHIFAANHVGEKELRLSVEEKDLYVAEAFLLARYHYNLQIPYHRTRSGYDFVLKRFLRDTQLAKPMIGSILTLESDGTIKTLDNDEFRDLDDYQIFEMIKKEARKGNFWAKCLMREEHLVPVLDTTDKAMDGAGKNQLKQLESELLSEGLEKNEDFFIQKKKIEIVKPPSPEGASENDLEVTKRLKDTIFIRCERGKGGHEDYEEIRNHSWLFAHLQDDPPVILRVYVKPEYLKKARDILTSIAQ